MLLLEDLILVTIWLLVTVIAINLVFLAFVFYRRWWRARYYRAKDEARERYRRAINEFVAGDVATQTAAASLAEGKAPPERDAIQELLLDAITPQNADRITELLVQLKYVELWSRTAFGRTRTPELMRRSQAREPAAISTAVEQSWRNRFRQMRVFSVPRALAVDHLGNLAPECAQVFTAEALHDPSTEVRRVAVAAMGRSRNPAAIPMLLEELHKAITEGNDVSLRTTKAALVCYQLADLQYFIPHVTHPNPRMRFFVVDTLREICNRAGRKGSRAGSGISSRLGSGIGSGISSGIGSGVGSGVGSGIGSGAGSSVTTTGLLTRRGFPPELCEVLLTHSVNDSFADVRARAAALVAHFRDAQAVEALRRLLDDENEFVRLHAVRMCGDRYYGDLIPEVLKCMADNRWRVREAAVKTLGAFGVAGLSELYKYFVSTGERYESEQIAEEIQRTGLVDNLLTALG
ncbi:MAG: HEAT repeat domain-containing protein, partial [Terriglobales bacterium]